MFLYTHHWITTWFILNAKPVRYSNMLYFFGQCKFTLTHHFNTLSGVKIMLVLKDLQIWYTMLKIACIRMRTFKNIFMIFIIKINQLAYAFLTFVSLMYSLLRMFCKQENGDLLSCSWYFNTVNINVDNLVTYTVDQFSPLRVLILISGCSFNDHLFYIAILAIIFLQFGWFTWTHFQ